MTFPLVVAAEPISDHAHSLRQSAGDRLLRRICVRAPYFALRALESPEPGEAVAWLRPEQPLGAEAGPIAAAEVGRHLPILGSVAAASLAADDSQRYYLARAAHFERVCGDVRDRARTLVATCRAHFEGPRTAFAHGSLRDASGAVTHRLSVEYMVLGARVFERMFREHQASTTRSAHNPHAEPLLLAVHALDDVHARATACFSAEQCAGHFDGCPAVPVARLMQALSSLAGGLFHQRLRAPSAGYVVTRADIRAHRLAFAGDQLVLHAEHEGDRRRELAVRCRATLVDGAPIGELQLVLERAE